jgi:transcriptional regulator of arginine metabolism
MLNKSERQRTIKELVGSRQIRTQKELTDALRAQGFKVTQATISRDIAEIPLQKIRTLNGIVYHWRGPVMEPGERLARILRDSVLSISRSENLVLLKTGPGMAAPVAVALDGTPLELKLGTIAGDDTVLVIAKDKRAGHELRNRLLGMLA